MKKSSEVKYFGIAAAVLLSLGAGLTPALTAGTHLPTTAQAATDTTDYPAFLPATSGTSGTAGYVQVNGAWQPVTLASGLTISSATKTTTTGPTGGTAPMYYIFPGASYTTGTGSTATTATGDVYVAATGLTKQYSVDFFGGATSTAPTITTDGTTAADAATITKATSDLKQGTLKVGAAYSDGTANFFAFKSGGNTYFINATAVNSNGGMTTSDTIGTITTKSDNVKTYKDAALNNDTGKVVRDEGTKLTVDKIAKDGSGNVLAYHIKADASTGADTWVSASDVTYTANKLYRQAATGTLVAKDEATIYSDKETTAATDMMLAKGETVKYDVVVKNSVDDSIVAYGIKDSSGNYTYVKASDMAPDKDASMTIAILPQGTAIYSNYKAATIYSDASASADSGTKLATSVNEWAAFAAATNSDGTIIAYKLGNNQWVKAADLQIQQDLSGTFDTAAGSTLYSSDGTKAGSISAGGAYKVFAVRYIDGKQSLKLGTDNQWIHASDGAYYPE